MRVVVIGDIGVSDDIIHIGDEAMLDEMVTQLRGRGASQITVVSSVPAESAERYGVDAVERIGFFTDAGRSRDVALDRMDRVLRTAAGETGLLAADDTGLAVIAAISAADGVAIAGGGNIASTWPTHIFERATIGAIARILGKPLVVSGQTIGPFLTDDDEKLVTELLSSAALVGLRERPSFEYSMRLGVPAQLLNQTVDDASFLGIDADSGAVADGGEGPGADAGAAPYCVVTLAAHINGEDRDLFDLRTAELLDSIAESTGLEIVFFAHFGSTRPEVSHGDALVHERVAARMTTSRVRTEPTTTSVAAAQLARGASLSLSLRYHPAVFAVSAGVPTIGIAVDDYTTTKLTGALGNFGQRAVLPLADLLAGDGPALAARVWANRGAIRSAGIGTSATNRVESQAWWDRVAGTLLS